MSCAQSAAASSPAACLRYQCMVRSTRVPGAHRVGDQPIFGPIAAADDVPGAGGGDGDPALGQEGISVAGADEGLGGEMKNDLRVSSSCPWCR